MEVVLATVFAVLLIVALAALLQFARGVLLPSRAVTLIVNDSRKIQSETNLKLLEVLNDNGIAVPSACAGAGTCGLCRVKVAGAGEPLPTEGALLSLQEVRDGTRLACQVTIRSPLEIAVPEEILGVTSLECRVASTVSLTPLIKEIVLTPPPGAPFSFRAGGFVQVTAPPYRLNYSDIAIDPAHEAQWERLGLRRLGAHSAESVSRAYSVASRPQDEGKIVLNIRLATPPPGRHGVPPGIVSSWLFGLKVDDQVAVSGPYGHFGAADSNREMVFIGGGVGMAPLRAMIHDELEKKRSGRRIRYWYGARSRSELFYVDEFEELERRHPNFRWTPALSEPAAGEKWTGEQGFVHDVVFRTYLGDHPAPEDCEYYLCGPPLMIEAVYAMLDSCGVEENSIFNDDFGI